LRNNRNERDMSIQYDVDEFDAEVHFLLMYIRLLIDVFFLDIPEK